MATAARTAAGSGASASTCSAPPDGLPVGFELAPANAPERVVAAELLERVLAGGEIVIADKGFAGAGFEQHVASLGARLLRPDRKDEQPRFGNLGGIREWIEPIFDTLEDQLSLERHGGRTLAGLISGIARRLLALTASTSTTGNRQPRPHTHRRRPLRDQSSRAELGGLVEGWTRPRAGHGVGAGAPRAGSSRAPTAWRPARLSTHCRRHTRPSLRVTPSIEWRDRPQLGQSCDARAVTVAVSSRVR